MELSDNMQLVCPIRGLLKVNKRSKDGLTPTEEFFRIEAIKYLLGKGYPKENFRIEPIIKRFGNSGRNSFRSDFAVLDTPIHAVDTNDSEILLEHALLICEVKKDSRKNEFVRQTQIKPMLDFAKRTKTVALYWDNVDRRVFWNEIIDGQKVTKEGPLSFLPSFGCAIETKPLAFENIEPVDSLIDVFKRIEDILHQATFPPEKRYEIILQLLLAKIFDEHAFETRPLLPLNIQDYASLGFTADMTKKKIAGIVKRAVSFYEKHLPNKISDTLELSGDTLFEILRVLAPVKIIQSKRDVVQTFYMKFAKDLYKWDMAQYFTPTTVTDFIVDIINPQFGEHIADPACGSADFLVAAFRIGRKYNPGFADCVWGIDNSPNAVQVAVLNMVLNGDGKTNIIKDDSLENIEKYSEKFDIITCNPPFGTKIVEKRKHVLQQFDLAFDWSLENGNMVKTNSILSQQETGILFVELCLKACKPGGRIAIILPNGYLGNRSEKYHLLREWLLRHARIAAIVSLPRFTFKSSGADVSASVIYLEKRLSPLLRLEDEDYSFAVEMIEKVGWDAGNKKATPMYVRNQDDGSLIIDESGSPIIDCDFEAALKRISASDAATFFEWLRIGKVSDFKDAGWTSSIAQVYGDPDLTLDPKRYSKKVAELRSNLLKENHMLLGELVDIIPERQLTSGKKAVVIKSQTYQYVEIQDMGYGEYYSHELRGWELPSRARHFAEADDIFFGAIWGSVTKWCFIAQNAENVVITNGCYRCRMKKGKEIFLPDLLTYLNSEGWAVQMRAFARGSDGLAEICISDVINIVIPILPDSVRQEISYLVDGFKMGKNTLNAMTKLMLKEQKIKFYEPEKRPSHIVLV